MNFRTPCLVSNICPNFLKVAVFRDDALGGSQVARRPTFRSGNLTSWDLASGGSWLVGTWLVGNLTSWDVLTLLDRTGPSPIHHCWLCTSWHVPLTAEFYIKLTREVLNGACQQSFGSYYILLVPWGSGVGQSEKDNLEADTIPQAWRRCRKRFGLYQTHDTLHFAICKFYNVYNVYNLQQGSSS